jgi:hypothetical protein
MRKTFIGAAALPALGLSVATVVAGLGTASADPLPYGPDTCINGYVWRNARDGDSVCVTPATRDQVAAENTDPDAHRDPAGAYGPQSCAQGWVWRQAFDGDTICVTPDIRTQTLADNAAAQSRMAANRPQQPSAQQNTMVWKATGHGPTYNVTIDDDKRVQTISSKDLPFDHSEALDVKPGDLYQIVVSGKGDAVTGCEIDYNGQVVASQPVNNSSAQCIWNVPPN